MIKKPLSIGLRVPKLVLLKGTIKLKNCFILVLGVTM